MLTAPRYRPIGACRAASRTVDDDTNYRQGQPDDQGRPYTFAHFLDNAPNAPPLGYGAEPSVNNYKDSTFNKEPKERDLDTPQEFSANRVVPVYTPPKREQNVLQCGDPRFVGKVNAQEIQKNYAFIGDLRREELKEYEAQYKELPDSASLEERAELRDKIIALKRKLAEMGRRKAEADMRKQLVEAELRAVAQGKKAYFLKDREITKLTSQRLYCDSMNTRKGEKRLQKAHNRRLVRHFSPQESRSE